MLGRLLFRVRRERRLPRRIISGIMLTLLLISMLTFAFNVQQVKASPETIYIRADGSIDPPGASIPQERVFACISEAFSCILMNWDEYAKMCVIN